MLVFGDRLALLLVILMTKNIFCQVCEACLDSNQQFYIQQVYIKADVNEELMKIIFEPNNETHFGVMSAEFFQDLTMLSVQFLVSTTKKKYVDQTLNLCKWMENKRTNYLINFFKNYLEKSFNPKLFNCPIKKGFYIVAKAREKPNPENFVPSFIPMKGNVTIVIIYMTRLAKQMQPLLRLTETFDLKNDDES